MSDPLARAIAACGGTDGFLADVKVSARTLADWRRFGIPDTRWHLVEQATRGAVTAEEMAKDRSARLARRGKVS